MQYSYTISSWLSTFIQIIRRTAVSNSTTEVLCCEFFSYRSFDYEKRCPSVVLLCITFSKHRCTYVKAHHTIQSVCLLVWPVSYVWLFHISDAWTRRRRKTTYWINSWGDAICWNVIWCKTLILKGMIPQPTTLTPVRRPTHAFFAWCSSSRLGRCFVSGSPGCGMTFFPGFSYLVVLKSNLLETETVQTWLKEITMMHGQVFKEDYMDAWMLPLPSLKPDGWWRCCNCYGCTIMHRTTTVTIVCRC